MPVPKNHPGVRLPLVVLLLVALLAAAYRLLPGPWQASSAGTAVYSGTVETDETLVVSEIGGRLVELTATEGATVGKGNLPARLDDATMRAQTGQAQAAVATAKARLAQLQAAARLEDVSVQRAAVAQAVAARDGARDAWQSALRARDIPLDLDIRVEGARAALEIARGQVTLAQANLETARVQRDHDRNSAPLALQVTAADAGVTVAQAAVAKAEAQLASLLDLRREPLAAQNQVILAETAYQSALASVAVAQARMDALLAGPTRQDLALATAGVDQANAALAILAVQEAKLSIRSPLDGLIVSTAARVGELVGPGSPVLTIADLSRLYLTVYVPEDEIGLIRLAQPASVNVDAYPGRVLTGTVSYISPRAEFTPKSVQTQKERVSTVFAVRIRLGSGETVLKPGMPADVRFGP